MRYHLPSLQRELETFRHFGSPFLKRFDLGRIVEGVLYLDAVETLGEFVLSRTPESASADLEILPRFH